MLPKNGTKIGILKLTFSQQLSFPGSENILVTNGTSYLLSSSPMSYVDASIYCSRKGMRILSLEMESKFQEIVTMVGSIFFFISVSPSIGLHVQIFNVVLS
jgi:hypothetical protein